ncbi:MAG: hypothetical protein K0Q74_1265 [Gammaproteobacteria bacterium]|nr:hypothetical protein [Gammaproteobacteria bacterium]
MPGRSTTSSNDNIGLGDYLESVYNGGAAFAGDLRTAIQHPIDTLIIPPLALAYDVAIVGSATMGAAVLSDPQFDLYQSEIAEIRGAVKKDPQIVEDAKARLHARKEMLIEAAEKFVANDGPGRTEMATHLGLNLLTPGYFSKALKAVSNVRKFGTPFNPPRFQYLEKHDFSNLPPIKHLSRSEIRKQHMDGELLYVVKPNGQLLLGDRDYIQALGCDFWGHPELAWPDPIIAAGEVVFSGGKIIKINNMSGHFRPSGPKLKSYVETVFEKNGYSEAPGLFEYIPKSKRLLKSDTMLPSSSLGFGPSPLGMMAGITMTATHGSTPYFNSSFLFGMAYAESMSNPYTKARAQASFPPHSSQNKKHTTTPTTPEEAQQALDDLEKQHLQALLELFGDIVTASETLDISDVKDMQGIQEQYEEIEALKSQQETHGIDPNLTQQIADKTRALKSQIIPEIIKRKKFTENLQYASDTLTGLRRGVGVIDAAWARRAEEVLTVGSSVLTGLEQGAALFGMGIAAASLNPVLAFGTIVGAVGNVLSLFQKKQQQDPGEMQLRIANLFFQRMEQLEKSMLIEFSKLSSQVADMGWHTLAKLTGMAERQHDTLSFLNSISLALNQMRADQSAQLVVHSAMLSEILVNIAGNTYLMNLDQLREELRFITTNSLFPDYNTRTNKLDHLGVQTSYDQPSNLFLLEGTKPASYLQIPSYFARLISPILARENHTVDERAELPSPLPILYAANGKIILGYKQYPEPNASRLRLRIAQREIAQLKIYKTELEKLVALTAQARHPSLVDHFIAAYKVAATTLQTAIVEKTLAIEDLKTNSIHKSRMADLAEVHGKEENRFNAEIGVRAYEWFKGMDRWKSYFRGKHGHRRASNGRYDGVPDSSADYEDLKRRLEYIESQRKHIKNGKENWSIKISEFLRQLADTNHLSTSVLANISIYHGARYLKPTQSGLPYLPAPNPLLP